MASKDDIFNVCKCRRHLLGLPNAKQLCSREGTQPYHCSVDTWGIAAVLFHLLSGHPAWVGTMEDGGAVMLEKIMTTNPDWTLLTLAGVSRMGLKFLKRMLQIEPANRATDEEVLAHRWIR